ASTTGGAVISCSAVNLSAHTHVYFGIRNDSNVNGNTMTNSNPTSASAAVFHYSSQNANSITYTSTTTVNGFFHPTHSVNNTMVLTLTAGSASVVATGGTPLSNNNGDIERIFQIGSGSSFSIRADVQASDGFFGPGQASTVVYDPNHVTGGAGGERS